MELYPAIDLRDGRCVRLRQGDYDDETHYGDDPVAVALSFAEAGVRWVHTVDLDAARSGEPRNRPVIAAMAAALAARGVALQAGGGVRSEAAAKALLDAGVRRVVIGTKAVEEPSLVAEVCAVHPGGVAIGLDTRTADGRREVATHGWTAGSGVTLDDALASLSDAGASAVIVTDIGRDGMLTGPDLDGLAHALRSIVALGSGLALIASGGIAELSDLDALRDISVDAHRVHGAITGKAIYERRFTVAEAVRACAS